MPAAASKASLSNSNACTRRPRQVTSPCIPLTGHNRWPMMRSFSTQGPMQQLIFGIYMVVGGILAILLAFKVRSFGVRLGAVV